MKYQFPHRDQLCADNWFERLPPFAGAFIRFHIGKYTQTKMKIPLDFPSTTSLGFL